MSITVTLIASEDGQLEDLLRNSGMKVAAEPAAILGDLAHPAAAQPDVVVIDVRSQTQLPPALPLLTQHHPATGVLLVASRLDPTLMLEAMRARVRECVAEPVDPAELKAAIDRLIMERCPPAAGQVVAFLGAKGGVGTTTAAVNVATALARVTSAPTLLIDLHLGCGDAALYLGAGPRFSIVDALENIRKLDETFLRRLVVRASSTLDLLAAPNRMIAGAIDADHVRRLVEFAARYYRYVVLDVPGSDPAMLEAIAPVSTITIVVNQELAAVRNAGRIASAIGQRFGKERVAVVLSRYDPTADIGCDDVERVTSMPVKWQFPNSYAAALDAANKGRPLALDNHNNLAAAFIGFARELSGAAARTNESTGPSGLFRRLTRRRAQSL